MIARHAADFRTRSLFMASISIDSHNFRRLPIAKFVMAKTEAAGPLLVPYAGSLPVPKPCRCQSGRQRSPGTIAQRKPGECDPLHITFGRPVRNDPNGPENIPIIVRPAGDIGTDYALIAIGVGAALVALIYLLLHLIGAGEAVRNSCRPAMSSPARRKGSGRPGISRFPMEGVSERANVPKRAVKRQCRTRSGFYTLDCVNWA